MYDMPRDMNWSWESEEFEDNTTIPAKDSVNLVERTEYHGWVWYTILSFNSANCGYTMKLEPPRGDVLEYDNTVSELQEYGLNAPTSQGWFVTRYDPPESKYNVAYAPSFPGTPFRKLAFSVKNTGSSLATLLSGRLIILRMWD
jgi:hypothetical protein